MFLVKENFVLKELTTIFSDKVSEPRVAGPREVYLRVEKDSLHSLIQYLKNNFNLHHIVTITGIDMGETIDLIYHVTVYDRSLMLNIKTSVPKENPVMKSVCSLLPGAVIYEREVHDMLGVVFDGHPNLERLLLADDWPENSYPLRKDWKMEDA